MASLINENNFCQICCEKFNKSTRKQINCSSCDFDACNSCWQTYLLSLPDNPHCMKCKSNLSNMFCFNNFTKTFMNKVYKNHQKDILFQIEKAKIPATMPYIEALNNVDKIKDENTILHQQIEQLRAKIYQNERKIRQNYNIYYGDTPLDAQEHKKFVKKCPANECNGFLSTAWKCEVCKLWTCPKCEEIIGETKDNQHVCDENKKISIEFIRKDTKPCPSCSANIFKISGCSQIWCTNCNIAFSWNTGRKINGNIHNPHYFEWLNNQNNGHQAPHQPGHILCGGLPRINQITNLITPLLKFTNIHDENERQNFKNRIQGLWRVSAHINDIIIGRLRDHVQRENDREYRYDRIKFIQKTIDEKTFKTIIMKKKKKKDFETEVLHIYELFNVVIVETINHLYELLYQSRQLYNIVTERTTDRWGYTANRQKYTLSATKQELTLFYHKFINETVKQFNKIQKLSFYCNNELIKVSIAYNLQVETIVSLMYTPEYSKWNKKYINLHEKEKQYIKHNYTYNTTNIFYKPHFNPHCNETFPKKNPVWVITLIK